MLPLIQIHSFNYIYKLLILSIFPELQTQMCICLLNISWINKPPSSLLNLPLLLSSQSP